MSERDDRLEREMNERKEAARRQSPRFTGPMRNIIPTGEKHDVKGSVAKLLRFIGRYKSALVLALVFAVGSTVFAIVGPKVMSTATTLLFEGVMAKLAGTGSIDFDRISTVLLQTLALYLFAAACSFAQGWVLSFVAQKTSFNLRKEIAQKIDRLPVGYFESSSVGDVLSRITNDVDTLGQSLNQSLSEAVRSLVMIVGVLAMMLSINPVMALCVLLVLPISMLLVRLVVKWSQKYFFAQQESLGRIDGQIEETFSGHAVVKAFGAEDQVIRSFDETNERLYESAWKSQFLSGLMRPLLDLTSNLAYVAVVILGAVFAARGVVTVGDIQAFVQYVRNFTQPITSLAQVGNMLQQTAAAAERVFEFLEAPEEERQEATSSADGIATEVDFDHVRFGYVEGTPVIRDFTAHVKAGQTVALVGPTGAGKTTMMKLLMRFYDVQEGSIRIGGRDVRSFDRDELRSLFGMVLQDAWLFNGTVRENIRYGRPDATDAEVEAAAKRAFAHHFIETLPSGYDCVINEDASNISAGQRQLLTIARAFVSDRRMLILDEATSSVDTRTERRIQSAMDELMKGRTSFVIAHRLSTIRNADLILVIDQGDVVEQGTHDELIERGGFYADLYNSQFTDIALRETA